MLDERFVMIGVFLNFLGGIWYLKDTVTGKVRPNKVTWFLWAVAPLIAFAAELQKGVGWTSLMTFMVGFNPLLIFLGSFINPRSVWKVGAFDIVCGILTMAGSTLWFITREGNIAIIFSLLADFTAGLPTLMKSYHHPETENGYAFLFASVSALITVFTIKIWNFAHWAFPVYIFLYNCFFIYLILIRPVKLRTSGTILNR